MVETILSHPPETAKSPMQRVQHLLDAITVTTLDGRKLDETAKRGRVFAALRGHVPSLVTIDWNGIDPEALRAALAVMRGAE